MSLIRQASFAAALALGLGLGGVALAAGPAAASQSAAGMAGELAVGQIAGGLSDPVPIVATPMGLMLFTLGPPEEAAPTTGKPRTTPRARTLQTQRIGQR